MKKRICNALFGSLACLGLGVAIAAPTPVRNVHDPTVMNVATAPPHPYSLKVAQQTDPPATQFVLAAVNQALTMDNGAFGVNQSFDTALVAVIVLQSATMSPVVMKPNTATRVGYRFDTIVDTTAPPAVIDNLSITAKFSVIATSARLKVHGGGRNAEIV